MTASMHHYIESGLSNVYIAGIAIGVDEDGDEVLRIPAINELHRVIATGIVGHAKGISGAELRFLRTEMGLTQAELAATVHRDKQSIGRWERGEIGIDGPAEALVRRLAIEKLALPVDTGIDELSRRSVPADRAQPINIRKVDSTAHPYQLTAA